MFLDKNKIIAKSHPDGGRDLKILKEILLSDEFMKITNTLKEFEKEVKSIQHLYSDFIYEINRIAYNFPSLGLKGKCSVEKELSLVYMAKSFLPFH